MEDLNIMETSEPFDGAWYLEQYPDVRILGMDPKEHYLWIGKKLGRKSGPGGNVEIISTDMSEKLQRENPQHYFMHITDRVAPNEHYPLTNFMYYVWTSRLDLQQAFNLDDLESRTRYCEWFLAHGGDEYGVQAWGYPKSLLDTFSTRNDLIGERAQLFRFEHEKHQSSSENSEYSGGTEYGANLIGYARGEFGMGEHVRMVAESLNDVKYPFSIINVPEGGVHGESDRSAEAWIAENQCHAVNIFHINADVLPSLYFRFGENFFNNRYNIGYWAWELAECPPEFDTAMNMMDEIWGISEFVTDSFRQRSPVPVINMPLAVELPTLGVGYTKSYFGLSESQFTFLFTFDSASYLDRKNPVAAVRAFKRAFPAGNESVRLVLKTMNVTSHNPLWDELIREVETDRRVTIMTRRLKREEVIGLYSACDAFVSLHRSEGFGRCMAEAMLLGKPVIATGYSGSSDFIREGVACVVDYKLLPVAEGVYPFWRGQEWAEPDVEHAAAHMRRLVDDTFFRKEIARAGQSFIKDNFNAEVIGARYIRRLEEIHPPRLGWTPTPSVSIEDDQILGHLDLPANDPSQPLYGPGISVSGWAISKLGITNIEVFCDEVPVGEAHIGVLRPDIGECHPEMVNSARSGYGFLLDASSLSIGRHTLAVKAKSLSGKTAEWRSDFLLADSEELYAEWLTRNQPRDRPYLSIILIEQDGIPWDEAAAEQTLRSLSCQDQRGFEVLIAMQGSAGERLLNIARRLESDFDFQIRLVQGEWIDVISKCHGEFIGLVCVGDVLDPRTVFSVACNIQVNSEIDFIYADEDIIDNGERQGPNFKPAWSPLYLDSCNYIGRPWFARRSLVESAAIEASNSGENSEYALIRQMNPKIRYVSHIPMVLMSRPQASFAHDSSALIPTRQKSSAPNWPRVSVIIPTRLGDRSVVEACFKGLLENTDYPDLEVIVVANNLSNPRDGMAWLKRWPFQILEWNRSYNWSALNNYGAKHSSGEFLLFLNDDIEPLNSNWLKTMVDLARLSFVGAVGALLKYPNGRIQHAGINIVDNEGIMQHIFRMQSTENPQISRLIKHDREQSAVTGACLVSSKDVFELAGGFDESLPVVCNDTDYCLTLSKMGFSSVLAADAQLTHHEGVSRANINETADFLRFQSKWKNHFSNGDPFTNPNLDGARGDWSVSPTANGSLIGRILVNARSRII